MSYKTGYTETELLLASMEGDDEYVEALLDSMFPGEINSLWHKLSDLETTIGKYMTQRKIEH